MSSVRRKRKTLSNVLTQMDTRLRSAELKQIKTGAGTAIEATSLTPTETSIGTVVSDNAPSDWIKVVGGAYYSKRVTGETDRVELYLQADTGAYTDNTLTVSGINTPYDVSGDFIVTAVTPTGDDRPSWMNSIPSGVTSTIVYTTGQDIPESAAVSLVGRYQVESYSATTTHATVVFTADHGFAVGDVISTSELDSPFDGLDGIFKVTGITADSVTYAFDAEIVDDIESTTPGSTVYVYAVTQRKTAAGDTWIDTSTTPSTTYYWNGLRWSLSRSAATEGSQDTLAPADVTEISSTSSAYTIDGGIARARVTLSWTAPTKNSDDTDLTDLAGYEVWANYTGFEGPWTEKTGILSANPSTILSNLNQNVTVYYKVFAVDSSLNRSTGAEYSATTGIYALSLNPPSAPTLSTRNGVLTAVWDGLDNTGVNPPQAIRLIEVHASTSSTFTPSLSTLKGSMSAGSGSYFQIVDLTYDTDWYVKLVAVDVNGNKTSGSAAATTTVSRVDAPDLEAGSIRANKVEVGFLSGLLLEGETLRANSTSTTAFIEFTSDYFRAVNSSGQETFKINSSNGVTTIGASTVISGNSITTGTINASNVTVTNLSANAITTGTLNAANVTVTNLSANAITTGTLNAANVTVTNLSANAITTGTLSGVTTRFIDSGGDPVGYMFQALDDGGDPSIYISYANAPDISASNIIKLTNGQFYARGGSGNSSAINLSALSGRIEVTGADGNFTVDVTGLGSSIDLNADNVRVNGSAIGGGSGRIRIPTSLVADASYSSTDHPVQIGDTGQPHLRIDNNEILAVSASNGASGLYLNIDGGSVHLGAGWDAGSPSNTVPGMGIDSANGYCYANGVYGRTLTTTYRSVYVSAATSGGAADYPQNRLGYVASSRRYKKNIEPLEYTADQILAVEPVQYNYNEENDTDSQHAGFIAEQLHDLGLHGYVSYTSEGLPDTVQYEFYVSALQTVVRHQADQISDLQARLLALETRVNSN